MRSSTTAGFVARLTRRPGTVLAEVLEPDMGRANRWIRTRKPDPRSVPGHPPVTRPATVADATSERERQRVAVRRHAPRTRKGPRPVVDRARPEDAEPLSPRGKGSGAFLPEQLRHVGLAFAVAASDLRAGRVEDVLNRATTGRDPRFGGLQLVEECLQAGLVPVTDVGHVDAGQLLLQPRGRTGVGWLPRLVAAHPRSR